MKDRLTPLLCFVLALMFVTGATLAGPESPAALPVAKDCFEHRETHTLVRMDVLATLNASDKNLALCEPALDQAQTDLTRAKADLLSLQKAAIEQRAVIAEYKAQKRVLEAHITKLEGIVCPEPTLGDQLAQGWENVDGVVGIGAGYALGTSMCIGLAYVFNQPAFTR